MDTEHDDSWKIPPARNHPDVDFIIKGLYGGVFLGSLCPSLIEAFVRRDLLVSENRAFWGLCAPASLKRRQSAPSEKMVDRK